MDLSTQDKMAKVLFGRELDFKLVSACGILCNNGLPSRQGILDLLYRCHCPYVAANIMRATTIANRQVGISLLESCCELLDPNVKEEVLIPTSVLGMILGSFHVANDLSQVLTDMKGDWRNFDKTVVATACHVVTMSHTHPHAYHYAGMVNSPFNETYRRNLGQQIKRFCHPEYRIKERRAAIADFIRTAAEHFDVPCLREDKPEMFIASHMNNLTSFLLIQFMFGYFGSLPLEQQLQLLLNHVAFARA